VSYRRENDDPSLNEAEASKGKRALIFITMLILFFAVFFGMGRAFHWLFSYLF